MNALTIPRTVAGAEYTVFRLPLTLVEKKVLPRFDEDNSVRLTVEKALGSIDATVGRFLADPELTRRGATLSRRADILTKAVQLEEKAEARKAKATTDLKVAKKQADAKREQAVDQAQAKAKALHDKQQAEKRAAEERAIAQAKAKAEAAERETQARLQAEESKLASRVESIETRTEARTAAPRAQLGDAVKTASLAAKERKEADRLAQLAQAEKASRKS
jgi:hypothetical protein